jgi:hypothetical protein
VTAFVDETVSFFAVGCFYCNGQLKPLVARCLG